MGGDAMSSDASGDAADAMVNKGFIALNAVAERVNGRGRTFIVTGQQRSGTSLVAAVLRQVGIFMGAEINDHVHEDEALAKILIARDRNGLRRTIRERDANFGTWGFKFPMLCDVLAPADLGLFSNPHVIVPMRDPIAVAVRRSLSEFHQPMPALRDAAKALAAMVDFVDRLNCPVLLLSYEKSLVLPGDFIDAIVRFGDLPQAEALRERLIGLIEPNRKDYIDVVRRQYTGIIEGITDGWLCGWSRLTASADPVALELLADDQPVLAFQAELFRQDLLDAGYGAGRHGFRVDLRALKLRPEAVVRIRVAAHGMELENSGRRLAAYRVLS
jgi:hypothetical protein